MQTLGFIGFGLIGGSIAKGLKKEGSFHPNHGLCEKYVKS